MVLRYFRFFGLVWLVVMCLSAHAQEFSWQKLNTVPFPGKQDDIVFINEQLGWYVNGSGFIYSTKNGGKTWEEVTHQPGTFFRCIAFLDSLKGFAGNVGTDYFPNVSDTVALYRTTDGGNTWRPVNYSGPAVKGLCAIEVVDELFVNHGIPGKRQHIFAVGRVGSPAMLLHSADGGQTFESRVFPNAAMLMDIKMLSHRVGFVCAASNADVAQSNAVILKTEDGGVSWKEVYRSDRKFELTWKMHFPTADTGYATLQSYNPDTLVKEQYVLKTVNGGESWQELSLVQDAAARSFGVGFLSHAHGFVGTLTGGFETRDGGATWNPVDLGRAVNKFRIHVNPAGNPWGYAIGVDVFKLQIK